MYAMHPCRYFHDMPEKADQEQLANITEMLRVMTYSRGWQGVDGPPDPESKPFSTWDGVVEHWRGDARREEMKNPKTPAESEKAVYDTVAATSAVEGDGVADEDSEGAGSELDEASNVVDVQEIDDAEVLPPEEVLALQGSADYAHAHPASPHVVLVASVAQAHIAPAAGVELCFSGAHLLTLICVCGLGCRNPMHPSQEQATKSWISISSQERTMCPATMTQRSRWHE